MHTVTPSAACRTTQLGSYNTDRQAFILRLLMTGATTVVLLFLTTRWLLHCLLLSIPIAATRADVHKHSNNAYLVTFSRNSRERGRKAVSHKSKHNLGKLRHKNLDISKTQYYETAITPIAVTTDTWLSKPCCPLFLALGSAPGYSPDGCVETAFQRHFSRHFLDERKGSSHS